MTPAEERAQRDGLPVVLLIPFECLRIAAGNPMIVGTADGGEALARLATPDEFYNAHVEACRLDGTAPVSREECDSWLQPWDGTR